MKNKYQRPWAVINVKDISKGKFYPGYDKDHVGIKEFNTFFVVGCFWLNYKPFGYKGTLCLVISD